MWLLFLAAASVQARQATGGHFPTPEDHSAFRGLIVRLKAPFPIRRAVAHDVGAAVLRLAHALGDAITPEDRDELGELLLRGVRFLDRVLYEHDHDAAELSRRISGQGED